MSQLMVVIGLAPAAIVPRAPPEKHVRWRTNLRRPASSRSSSVRRRDVTEGASFRRGDRGGERSSYVIVPLSTSGRLKLVEPAGVERSPSCTTGEPFTRLGATYHAGLAAPRSVAVEARRVPVPN